MQSPDIHKFDVDGPNAVPCYSLFCADTSWVKPYPAGEPTKSPEASGSRSVLPGHVGYFFLPFKGRLDMFASNACLVPYPLTSQLSPYLQSRQRTTPPVHLCSFRERPSSSYSRTCQRGMGTRARILCLLRSSTCRDRAPMRSICLHTLPHITSP